jgi:hypothetical protein
VTTLHNRPRACRLALPLTCLLLCLFTCLPAPAPAALARGGTGDPGEAGDGLQRLGRDFWAWRAAGQPISSDDIPRVQRPPGWTPDWSAPAVAARHRDLERFEARWLALANPGRPVPEQVDHRLLGSALARVRWELDGVRLWRRDPGFYLAQTLGALVDALLPPPPFTQARGREVVERLASFPRTLADGRANLDQGVEPFARLALDDLADAGNRLRQAMAALRPLLAAGSRPRLDAETERAAAALESYRDWLGSRVASMPAAVAIGRDAYVVFLRQVALLPFTPEQILAMGR